MKWIFYVVVFIYLFFRAVYGAKVVPNTLHVDKINYGKSTFWKSGTRQSIICKPSNKNQEVEWIDPSGNVVKRVPLNRVFSQEHFVQTQKGRTPALMLTFKSILPKDSGHYTCQSDDLTDSVDVCVIEPLEFVDTPAEVAADTGRSITLSCQANGDPEPMITWKRNDEIIDDETNSTKYKAMRKYNSQGYEGLLTIISLEPGDSGVYHCEAKQENPLSADCTNSDTVNVTLHVNHPPSFLDGDDTKRVYATNNQSVQLVCSATGYPIPTFKWFRVVDSDNLNAIDDKLIEYNEERTQAVLSVMASTATFGQRYKCQVSNNLGDAEKHFTVLEIDKPLKPSQVNPFKSTDNQIDLKIMWDGPILFPINGFEIQFMKQEDLKRPGHQPRESDWNKAKLAIVDMDDTSTDEDEELPGIIASITDLDELTVYWVRLRIANDVGESPWCMPVLVTTLKKSEEETEPPTEEPVIEDEQGQNKTATAGLTGDPGTFYGIFFAGGIVIVAVVCMFAMRMV